MKTRQFRHASDQSDCMRPYYGVATRHLTQVRSDDPLVLRGRTVTITLGALITSRHVKVIEYVGHRIFPLDDSYYRVPVG